MAFLWKLLLRVCVGIPWALVDFVTIPTVEVSCLTRSVNSPILNLQSYVNNTINLLNINLRNSNSLAGLWIVSWHLVHKNQ